KKIEELFGLDGDKSSAVKKALRDAIMTVAEGSDILLDDVHKFRAQQWEQITEKSVSLFIETVSSGKEIGLSADEIHQLKAALDKTVEDTNILAAKEPAMLDDLERSEEDIAEYERQLVLMDAGGEEMAKQQSVEKLIAEMQKDRKVLELVNALGGSLT